jgi:hypothetical protein
MDTGLNAIAADAAGNVYALDFRQGKFGRLLSGRRPDVETRLIATEGAVTRIRGG